MKMKAGLKWAALGALLILATSALYALPCKVPLVGFCDSAPANVSCTQWCSSDNCAIQQGSAAEQTTNCIWAQENGFKHCARLGDLILCYTRYYCMESEYDYCPSPRGTEHICKEDPDRIIETVYTNEMYFWDYTCD